MWPKIICMLVLLSGSALTEAGLLSQKENDMAKREMDDLEASHKQSYIDNINSEEDNNMIQQEPIGNEQDDDYALEEDSSYPLDAFNNANKQWLRRRKWYRRWRQLRRRKRQRKNRVITTGVTYTRFGKSSCRRGAETVYKGVVAGTYYTYRGGGANYLCLPDHPEYSRYRGGNQGYSYLYGTEYEHPLRNGLHDHNVPCAVCYTPKRSTSLMIPAKINCPRSFTKEYVGYLMSDHRYHKRTEFICVDKAQESVRGTSRNTNGALLYHVEVHCHYGIPCSPYNSQKEVTCVVCSR